VSSWILNELDSFVRALRKIIRHSLFFRGSMLPIFEQSPVRPLYDNLVGAYHSTLSQNPLLPVWINANGRDFPFGSFQVPSKSQRSLLVTPVSRCVCLFANLRLKFAIDRISILATSWMSE